jgi:thiamine biosynthesis lipoprotein ApbE
VRSAIIDLGGNIVAVGTRPDGGPWQIGIQNPADVRGSYIGSVCVSDETVVTSGVNERFFMKDGVCYHHIIDPAIGLSREQRTAQRNDSRAQLDGRRRSDYGGIRARHRKRR